MKENPTCPRCRSWRSVVVVPNPKLGGFMLRCNKCKLEWLDKKP